MRFHVKQSTISKNTNMVAPLLIQAGENDDRLVERCCSFSSRLSLWCRFGRVIVMIISFSLT